MLSFRPLVALITAFTLLAALPVAGAEAKGAPGKAASKQKAAKKKHKNKKRKNNRKRPKPGQATPAAAGSIGSVTAVDGDLVTVTLTRGGSITAEVTDETIGACATEPDDEAEDDGTEGDILDFLDDDSDDSGDDDGGPDTRSQRLDDCAATVGAAVYEVGVDEGEYDVLDLTA